MFANQVLSGFPQSAYIVALVYGSLALFRMIQHRRAFGLAGLSRVAAGSAAAAVLGAAAGAVVLLPLAKLGAVSDRAEPLGYEWSTRLAYWPQNFWMFFSPYIHGNIADNSYTGPPFFWEDYGYVGLATVLLAIYAMARERRRPEAAYVIGLTIVAYLFVLGRATPVFHLAYLVIPGLAQFRFPTRFLVVVDLGLALLGGIGLTRLRAALAARAGAASRLPAAIATVICVATAADLFVNQPPQNPMVPADTWLAPPPTVAALHAASGAPRTFTPRHRDLHRRTFQEAKGWADVEPYFNVRDVLEPNLGGGLWDTPSGDCYAGISARWYVDVWGDHNREASLMALLAYLDFNSHALRVHPTLATALRTFGVTDVLSTLREQDPVLPLVGQSGHAFIYAVPGAARVRVVRAAKIVHDDKEAAKEFLDGAFDPDAEVLLHDAPDALRPVASGPGSLEKGPFGRAALSSESSQEVTVDAEAPQDAFLLLADTYYPGWTAAVDGTATPIYRADFYLRAVSLPRGRHVVRFHYEPPGFALGLGVSLAAVTLLLGWAAVSVLLVRRARRY